MQKIVLVAKREFKQRARQRGFWIMNIAVPLVFITIWLVAGGAATEPNSPPPPNHPEETVGYVDEANLIHTIPSSIPANLFHSLPDIQTANAALTQGEINAYFIIPNNYRETGHVHRVSPQLALTTTDVGWFNQLLTANLISQATPTQLAQLRQPFYAPVPEVTLITTDNRTDSQKNPMLPMLVTLAVIMPLFTSAGYLFQSMAQEKGSRILEILLGALHPRHLLTGKILGLGALTLLQYTIWGLMALPVMLITGQRVGQLTTVINLSVAEVGWIIPFALAGFMLYAALMAGVGALAQDAEDGRIWLFLIGLPLMIPIYLWTTIAANPNSPTAVALSLFPLSAPAAMLMRLTVSYVPVWQIASSFGLLLLTGVGAVWMMARLFRARTLLSGEKISLRRMWLALLTGILI